MRTCLGRRLLAAAGSAALMVGLLAAWAGPAAAVAAGDSPSGFWYGTDSFPVSVSGSAPYSEPVIGGAYGGLVPDRHLHLCGLLRRD